MIKAGGRGHGSLGGPRPALAAVAAGGGGGGVTRKLGGAREYPATGENLFKVWDTISKKDG